MQQIPVERAEARAPAPHQASTTGMVKAGKAPLIAWTAMAAVVAIVMAIAFTIAQPWAGDDDGNTGAIGPSDQARVTLQEMSRAVERGDYELVRTTLAARCSQAAAGLTREGDAQAGRLQSLCTTVAATPGSDPTAWDHHRQEMNQLIAALR